jgi:H+/Cl- antiporter ClcA
MTEEQQREYGEEERVSEHSGTNHSMAIGFYIAAIVLVYGVAIVLAGILTPAQQTEGDLGFNVNLWWGLVLVVSGCIILGLSLASPRRRAARQAERQAQR